MLGLLVAGVLALIGEPRTFDEAKWFVEGLANEITSKSSLFAEGIFVFDEKADSDSPGATNQGFPELLRQMEETVAGIMISGSNHSEMGSGRFSKLYGLLPSVNHIICIFQVSVVSGRMPIVANANGATGINLVSQVLFRLSEKGYVVEIKVRPKLFLGVVCRSFDKTMCGVGVTRGDLKGSVGIASSVAGELDCTTSIVQRNDDCRRAYRRNHYLPEGIFRTVAATLSLLPLGFKIASVVVLWTVAWRLIFRGLDGLEGWERTRRDGALSIVAGVLLIGLGVLFWF